MALIRSDANISDGAGNHGDHAFSYVCFERVLGAMEHLRGLSDGCGYYDAGAWGKETYNLGTKPGGASPRQRAQGAPTGLAQPIRLATQEAPTASPGRATTLVAVPTRVADEQVTPYPLTNAPGATLNALAKALAPGPVDSPQASVPQLTGGWLPLRFARLWRIEAQDPSEVAADDQKKTWGQGAVRALQEYNLGVQIDPLQLQRGDVLQLGRSADDPLASRPGFCFAVRRVRRDEVRFLLLSAQVDTHGIGVAMNDLARAGCLLRGGVAARQPQLFKTRLQDEDGDPLANQRYQIDVGGKVVVGTTDDDGRVAAKVPASAVRGTLSFWLDDDDDEPIAWEVVFRKDEGGDDEAAPIAHAAREEWIVSRGSAPFPVFVYHPGSLRSATFVTHAHRYGKWHVLRKGDGDTYGLFAPWRGAAHAGRPHREFPRYPIALGGSNDLEVVRPDGARDLATTLARYYRNTEDLSGGYFPIGRSRTWHSGVHLVPDDADPTVYAMLDGRVVAARLADPAGVDDGGEAAFPFGSGNFVLLKHGFEVGGTQHEVFSLSMHLADPGLRLVGKDRQLSPGAAAIPWLRDIALAPDLEEDKARVQDLDWRGIYLEVLIAPDDYVLAKDAPPLAVGDILEVSDAAPGQGQWDVWNGGPGKVKRVGDGVEGFLDPGQLHAQGGMVAPLDVFPSKHAELKERLLAGEVVDLWEEEIIVRCGDPIGAVGLWHGLPKVHVEVFSAALVPMKVAAEPEGGGDPEWTEKDAPDVDTAGDRAVFLDRQAFLEQFFAGVEEKTNEALGLDGEDQAVRIRGRMVGSDTVAPEDGNTIREAEVQAFFNDEANSLLPVLRNLVVRHLSEWGTACKWEDFGEAKEHFGDALEGALTAHGEKMARYAWWDDQVGQDAGLPSDQIAHYYHPITFLAWLEHERTLETPAGEGHGLHESLYEVAHPIVGPDPVELGDAAETRELRIRLADDDDDPLAGYDYELVVNGTTYKGTTDDDGYVIQTVDASADSGELKLWDEDEALTWPISLG